MKKYLKRIVVFLTVCLLCIAVIISAVFIYDKKLASERPPEPIASGDFPTRPYWIFKADDDVVSTSATNNKFLFVKTALSLYAVDISQKKVQWKVNSFTDQ